MGNTLKPKDTTEDCQKIKEKVENKRNCRIRYEEIFNDEDLEKLEEIAKHLIEIELENRNTP